MCKLVLNSVSYKIYISFFHFYYSDSFKEALDGVPEITSEENKRYNVLIYSIDESVSDFSIETGDDP